jgi:ribonuclease III
MNLFRLFSGLIRTIGRLRPDREPPIDREKVETAIGYHFSDPSLLFMSLKHRSYSQAKDGSTSRSNERLEFLGDSVLNMVVSHHLYIRNPTFQEGDLTKLKSMLVSKVSNALAARKIGIDRFILLSSSEEDAGGRERSSIVADTFEAVIGAIYLDGGLVAAEDFIRRTMLSDKDFLVGDEHQNYKSVLLELTQSQKSGHPVYRTVSEDGPDHDKLFTIEVFVMGESLGVGKAKNKKAAQQIAAKEALLRMNSIVAEEHRPL